MKEFGGYLELERIHGNEYYQGNNVTTFNCARSAIEFVLEKKHFEKVYLPYYLCESVREVVKKHPVTLSFYHIDEKFVPQVERIEEDAVILITNYYGIRNNNREYVEKYKNVIYDNTQSFFEKPITNAYNIYSCRKFFGVCDGAYLITELIQGDNYAERYRPRNASFILDALTYSTNEAYEESLRNEYQLAEDGIKKMSSITENILKGIDYSWVGQQRKKNYRLLHQAFEKINQLSADCDANAIPMAYPLLILDESVRVKLIDKKVYVSQWWKYLLEEENPNEFECYLAKYLLPLPIDQRYNEDSIKELIEIVEECI